MGTGEAEGRIDAARATIALTVRQRCFYLFCALVLLIVAVPLYEETAAGRIALNIMNLLILLSGASAIGRGGGAFIISLLLAAPAAIFQVLGYAVEDHSYVILSEAFAAGFYFITVTYLLLYALRREVLTMDKLYGAAAGYLMMGVMWAYFYNLLLWFHPGALAMNGEPLIATEPSTLLYFSFVTLTATGMSDILPVAPLARILCVFEMVTGVLFIAVLIARLAGQYPPPFSGPDMQGPIYLTADIRRIEQAAGNVPLMERAGAAAAELAVKLASGKDVLVLAGPGNNGGDARIAAELLKQKFFRVTVAEKDIPPQKNWGLVIDGLFGIGLARPIEGDYAKLVEYANRQTCPVLALDVPSGIQSDSGRALGPAIRASHTITFIALKPGLLTLDGPDHAGEISVADLDLDVKALLAPAAWIAGPHLFGGALKRRPGNFHKGMAGSLAVIGGAGGMTGAALLAGRAALKLGAGRVYVGLLAEDAPVVDMLAPELMLRHPDDVFGEDLDAMVVGPGLGRGERAETLVGAALASDTPCVLDADALNLMAESTDLRKACVRRKADTLLTPHPAEAARLLGSTVATIQEDRVRAARMLCENLNAHTVLKGNGSVLVARDGHWFINPSGNPGMASAGMGDVLAGMLGALLAQRYTGETALVLGVHLHGAAADALAKDGNGPVGLTASEIVDASRRIWNTWLKS